MWHCGMGHISTHYLYNTKVQSKMQNQPNGGVASFFLQPTTAIIMIQITITSKPPDAGIMMVLIISTITIHTY